MTYITFIRYIKKRPYCVWLMLFVSRQILLFFYFVNKSLPIVFHYSNHQLNCTQNMTVIQMLPIHLLRFRSPLLQSTSNNKSLTVPHYLNINYHPDLTHHHHQLIRIMYPYQVSYGVWHVYPWIDNSNRTQLT